MIDNFDGEYAFLSNFYESPMIIQGIIYPTNEHFFQAMKTLSPSEREKIASAPTPGQAKRLGRQVELRWDWESVKEDVMLTGLRYKFSNPDLKEKLLATGNEELVEGNWWGDQYWGVCDGIGKNKLGKLLMKVREELAN